MSTDPDVDVDLPEGMLKVVEYPQLIPACEYKNEESRLDFYLPDHPSVQQKVQDFMMMMRNHFEDEPAIKTILTAFLVQRLGMWKPEGFDAEREEMARVHTTSSSSSSSGTRRTFSVRARTRNQDDF